jgi:hypothetical protein
MTQDQHAGDLIVDDERGEEGKRVYVREARDGDVIKLTQGENTIEVPRASLGAFLSGVESLYVREPDTDR